MPDVLKETLYFTGPATVYFNDVMATASTGDTSLSGSATSDGSDATGYFMNVTGDGLGTNGEAFAFAYWAPSDRTTSTATGTVSFLRLVARGKYTGNGGSGWVAQYVLDQSYGTPQYLTTSYSTLNCDLATNPDTGLAWSHADLNNYDIGFELHGYFDDTHSPGSADFKITEAKLEVWGPSVSGQATTPSTHSSSVNPVGATLVPGVAVSAPSTAQNSLSSAVSWVNGGYLDAASTKTDPTSLVASSFVKGTAFTVSSKVASSVSAFGNESDSSSAVQTAPVLAFPASGTLSHSLSGVAAASLSGQGDIYGVKMYARVKARTDAFTCFDQFRFIVQGDPYAVTAPPIYGMSDLGEPFCEVSSSVITLNDNGNPFSWGSGSDSLVTQASGWAFEAAYTLAAGKTGSLELSEAWIEVIRRAGPTTAQDPSLTQSIVSSPLSITTTSAGSVQ